MKLDIEPVHVPRGYVHPPPPDDRLPRHEFTLGIIAPKGSGKTTLIVNLLKFYKGYFHNILVFSPTVASDEKWDMVKDMNLLTDNKPLKDYVKSLKFKRQRTSNEIVDRPQKGSELEELISTEPLEDKRIPESNFYSDYDEDTLREIMAEQMALVKLLKQHDKSKHMANRYLLLTKSLDHFRRLCWFYSVQQQ